MGNADCPQSTRWTKREKLNMADRLTNDINFAGDIQFLGTVDLADDSIENRHLKAGADVAASKVVHRQALQYGQADGSNVVSETKLLHIARATGAIKDIEARVTTAPAGGDLQFTVDVQKASDGSGSWTSLLDSVLTFADGDSDDTLKPGTLIASPSIADGDAIRVVITASGSTGSQGQGLGVTINLDENPT